MYLNDLHILYYLGIGFIGMLIGQLIDWYNLRIAENKPVFSLDFFTIYIKNMKPHYTFVFLTAILYVANLYIWGINNIITYQNMFLMPLLISIFDYGLKKQDISKRTILTLFEICVFFTTINGISNLNIAIENIIGSAIAALISLMIIFLEDKLFKKEKNKFEDMKLIVILGLLFGYKTIIIISIISYLVAAITDIILSLSKKKTVKEKIGLECFVSVISIFFMLVSI